MISGKVEGDIMTKEPDEREISKAIYFNMLNKINKGLAEYDEKKQKEIMKNLYYDIGQILIAIQKNTDGFLTKDGNYRKLPGWYFKLNLSKTIGHPTIDHTIADKEGNVYLEPYSSWGKHIETLLKICKENNIEVEFKGESHHFPAHTFRIKLSKRKGEKQND